MRVAAIFIGIALAAVGGVIAYRAAFLEPHAAVFVTTDGLSKVPNVARVAGGLLLFVAGAALAFVAARKRR